MNFNEKNLMLLINNCKSDQLFSKLRLSFRSSMFMPWFFRVYGYINVSLIMRSNRKNQNATKQLNPSNVNSLRPHLKKGNSSTTLLVLFSTLTALLSLRFSCASNRTLLSRCLRYTRIFRKDV